ncbi:EGF-like growth factor Heparin-binding [Collichthys lucidus]|uniref:EGF-like growth factor Heparin-binding n=1 Tax=Collichthys lucidus TaxID=240159 RepID=A0A4U5UX96_COLLU|nr:EGF-like growth factor Heparin-binding [Collichthys lucidus]
MLLWPYVLTKSVSSSHSLSAGRGDERPHVVKRSTQNCESSYDKCERGYSGLRCGDPELVFKPQAEEQIIVTIFCVSLLIIGLSGALYFCCKCLSAPATLVFEKMNGETQKTVSPCDTTHNISVSGLIRVVCSALGTQGSEATFSGELVGVTGGPASGEGLQTLFGDDDELEIDEEVSGGDNQNFSHGLHPSGKDERRKKKGKGKKRKHKSKSTTAFNPEHTLFTNGYTSTLSTTEDPCTSTHLGYCIHGYCKYIEGLQVPVCICMKGYDGERCGIQTLGVRVGQSSNTELVQTVLVIIAVVLSVISCTAILLMTCAHYRSHKNFLASYLGTGTGTEQEKLQKPISDVVV